MIILLGGKKRTGKNTAKDIIVEYLQQKRKIVVEESFALVIKDIVCDLLDLTPTELDALKNRQGVVKSFTVDGNPISTVTHRKILQVLGTDVRDKHFDKFLWVDMFVRRLHKHQTKDIFVTVDDWRFPHEYERVRDIFGEDNILPIIIERDSLPQDDLHDLHDSETALDDFYTPSLIRIKNNDTIGDLRGKLHTVLEGVI